MRGQRVPRYLGGEGSVGAGAVWLVVDGPGCFACRLARVDPRSLRVTDRIRVIAGAAGVRVTNGEVWVTNPDGDVVQRVDPRRRRVVRTIRTGDMPRFLTTGDGAVTVGFGPVWISAPEIDTLWRLPLTRVPRDTPQT